MAALRQCYLRQQHTAFFQLRLPYVVAAQLSEPIKTLLRGDLMWTATELAGTEVAVVQHRTLGWEHPRR